jgi:2-isopropylmalate synthase
MMQQHPITKYRGYPPIALPDRQWPSRVITSAPGWCSVDLRDGNQALPVPMSVDEKVEFFELLVRLGFKEIEIGFPSASDTEFAFARRLVEEGRIPDDVTIQVLVQCREHLIRRTYQAIDGAPRAIVHFYNSTNPLQRRVTFGMSRDQIREVAVNAATLCVALKGECSTPIRFEYSPESFSDTELEFSLEVCEAVASVIQPSAADPLILNLPATVELFTPNIHADQIEWFCRNLRHRDRYIISLHTHNDRGTAVAATELGLMAGADRVEGTLFGNGERTGNLDIVTVALNLYTQGIDPRLDLSDLPGIRAVYERCTRMTVHDRHPYAGDLVFTAFSGSHQDAIKKGMDAMRQAPGTQWQVPYLPIDCEDIGRTYQAIIRINSQSGKGGVAYVLERSFGIEMPKLMHPEFGQIATALADQLGAELSVDQLRECFRTAYLDLSSPLELVDYNLIHAPDDLHKVGMMAEVRFNHVTHHIEGRGNGPIAAFVNALDQAGWKHFNVIDYSQRAVSHGSNADAASFIQIKRAADNKAFWGASIDSNIELGGLLALVSAFNRSHSQ